MNIGKTASFFLGLALLATTTASANAQQGVELGSLDCYVNEGTGFIFGSTKDISCVFTSANPDEPNHSYFGVINKFGLDIGTTGEAFMTWLVVAPTSQVMAPGILEGNYVGATAEATFAVGLGANVLVGGSNKSFALQPLSVQTQTGLNFAAGVAEVELRTVE